MTPLTITLLVLATLRLTRLVTTDSLSEVYLRAPLARLALGMDARNGTAHWTFLWSGLQCPWCVGFWIGCLTTASAWAWADTPWWPWVAGAFALNWIVGLLGRWV